MAKTSMTGALACYLMIVGTIAGHLGAALFVGEASAQTSYWCQLDELRGDFTPRNTNPNGTGIPYVTYHAKGRCQDGRGERSTIEWITEAQTYNNGTVQEYITFSKPFAGFVEGVRDMMLNFHCTADPFLKSGTCTLGTYRVIGGGIVQGLLMDYIAVPYTKAKGKPLAAAFNHDVQALLAQQREQAFARAKNQPIDPSSSLKTPLGVGPNASATPCKSGFVWRQARATDYVCAPPASRERVAEENTLHMTRRSLSGGAYGTNTCLAGFVWREAYSGDLTCVTPDARGLAKEENTLSPSRTAGTPLAIPSSPSTILRRSVEEPSGEPSHETVTTTPESHQQP